MKTIAALIAGLLLSMTTFVAGLVVALTYLDVGGEPPRTQNLDTATLWTTEPVAVERQTFERLPARHAPKEQETAKLNMGSKGGLAIKPGAMQAEAPADNPGAVIDPVTTSAIDATRNTAEPDVRPAENAAHARWCSRRYRSYQPATNTYRPFGGGRRTCQSPYSGIAEANADPEQPADALPETEQVQDVGVEDEGAMEQAVFDESPLTELASDHVQACMDRYRSYRPEDNTYQPYHGGPRQQCE